MSTRQAKLRSEKKASPPKSSESVDKDGKSVLMHAIDQWGNNECHINEVKYLILQRANLNIQDKSGKTPLMQASFYRILEISVLLLAKGANPQLKDGNGLTAKKWAEIWMRPVIAQLIEQKGG